MRSSTGRIALRCRDEIAKLLTAAKVKFKLEKKFNEHLFISENGYRIAYRVALKRKRATRRFYKDSAYDYSYATWDFNFHRHGQMDKFADAVLCIAVTQYEPVVFVIPWAKLKSKTLHIHRNPKQYAGKYAKYRDAWSPLLFAAGAEIVPI